MKVPYLELTEETDTHHLNSGEDEHAGNDEERSVEAHNVLTSNDFEDQKPGRHTEAGYHAEGSDGAEEVKRASHIAQQEANGQQIEEDAEGAGDTVVALAKLAGRIGDGNLADAGSIPGG